MRESNLSRPPSGDAAPIASQALVRNGSRLYSSQLANKLGVSAALFLQQVHYWASKNRHEHDSRFWCYNTQTEWAKQINVTDRTVRRLVNTLQDKGFLLVRHDLNRKRYDRTGWYTIDYEALEHAFDLEIDVQSMRTKCPVPCGHNVRIHPDKMSAPIPKSTQEMNSKEKLASRSLGKKPAPLVKVQSQVQESVAEPPSPSAKPEPKKKLSYEEALTILRSA